MKSKIIVITGATDCVGAAAARRLASDGHCVVLVGRSADKTAALAQELATEYFLADFTRLSNVRALADRLLAKYPRIDVLANNAGCVCGPERRLSPDRHEMTFQVNYLAGFLLTTLLIPRLIKSRATVICRSGFAHRFGTVDPYDLESEKNYSATRAYCSSQLAQILFVRELYRRYGRGRGIDTAAFHPGSIESDYPREATSSFLWLYHMSTRHPWAVTPEHGAHTLVFLAEGRPEVDFPSGQYFVRDKVAKPNQQAYDRMLAFELWNRSETMIDDVAMGNRNHRRSVTAHPRHTRSVLRWLSRNIDESVTFR
jgi:NAD(P)-dependent dehydrogenase (short-subunit alcohol dehydrogenase family)